MLDSQTSETQWISQYTTDDLKESGTSILFYVISSSLVNIFTFPVGVAELSDSEQSEASHLDGLFLLSIWLYKWITMYLRDFSTPLSRATGAQEAFCQPILNFSAIIWGSSDSAPTQLRTHGKGPRDHPYCEEGYLKWITRTVNDMS